MSGLFWLNAYTYGLGMHVALNNNKRFTYKRNFHFVTDSISKKIISNPKKRAVLVKNKFFLLSTPLQALDFFSIPTLSIDSEYFNKNNIHLSAAHGVTFLLLNYEQPNVPYIKDKASTYRLEAGV